MQVAGREVLKETGREQNSEARTSSKSLRNRKKAYNKQSACTTRTPSIYKLDFGCCKWKGHGLGQGGRSDQADEFRSL